MNVRNIFAATLLGVLAWGPLQAGAQEKLPEKGWKAKYQEGSGPFAPDQPLNVLVEKEAILLAGGNDCEEAINLPDVTQITYDTTRGRYVSRALAGSVRNVQSSTDLVLYMYTALPLAIVTLPYKGTRHFVTIEWTEGRRHRAVVLRMKGKTAKAFLAELERATGVTARNLDRERKEFRQSQKQKSAPAKQEEPAKTASPQGS